MLIRASGYNTGAQEYLEEGNKSGREFTRDELDHRLILDGQLSVTRAIYESIPDHGQDRYLTFTMSFKEDNVSPEVLKAVTTEFKQFLMHAYNDGEYNFYAEAHLPKIKTLKDKKTGDWIERKPHVHIIVPRVNLLSGNEANPVGIYLHHEKYFEAFQEYLNQKYRLASPRENVRVDITDAASVLSRYKGDDFYGKNREFKRDLVTQVIARDITSRVDFYELVAEYGEIRIRNQGKETEYLAVKIPGDAKFTNLKDTIFGDDFIVRRELKKPPLDKSVIEQRLREWPQRAREIKYVNKATPSFRERYAQATPDERVRLLAGREASFYQTYGEHHDSTKPSNRSRDHERSSAQTRNSNLAAPAFGMQNLPFGDVAADGQAESARIGESSLLLPSDAHLHLGQSEPGGDSGLRPSIPGGRRGGRHSTGRRSGRRQPAASVSASTTGARQSTAAGTIRTGPRTRIGDRPFPAQYLNPRRVPSIADIQERGKRLFEPLKENDSTGLKIVLKASRLGTTAQPARPVESSSGNRRSGRRAGKPGARNKIPGYRNTDNPLPPYARNPNRVAGIADIQQRSRALFEPLKRVTESPLPVRIGSVKALTRSRNASSVAAYLSRQAAHNQLRPDERRALRRINKQYFELRRSLFRDQRLTRQDKSQLASVLSFERLKATEAIHHPQHNVEVSLMGSAQIRKLITDETEDPGFSIGGAKSPEPEGVRVRVKRILDNMSRHLDPEPKSAQERELNAKDLYTRKARFSQNVHYLDKLTNKTLFVDTGKVISMRRTGITEAGVAVALQLAKERFGSTLTVNGTAEFKRLVVEAVAKNGMDIHFTDLTMNENLAARRAELEIEREGQSIEPAPSPAEPADYSVPAHSAATDEADNLVQREAQWRDDRQLTEDDVRGSVTVMGVRGEDHAMWLVAASVPTPESMEMVKAYLANDSYRESFKQTLEGLYGQAISPEDVKLLDGLTAFAVKAVNEIEAGRRQPSPGRELGAERVSSRKVITGELVEHGAAPYQHKPDKQPSYFVTLKTDVGERTVWGVGLEDAMRSAQFETGDQVRLEDHGTEPVVIEQPEADGSITHKTTHRRAWTAEGMGAAREVASSASVSTTSVPAKESPDQDHGPEMA